MKNKIHNAPARDKCEKGRAEVLYAQGKSASVVADTLGVGRGSVYLYLARKGIKTRGIREAMLLSDRTGKTKGMRIKCKESPLWSRRLKDGYYILRTPDGWIREHRYIMEQYIGRKLTQKEAVHHIDHNTINNNINNLQLMTSGNHIKLHHAGLKRSKETRKKMSDKAKLRCYFRHSSYKNILPSDIIDAMRNYPTMHKAAQSLGITKNTLYSKIDKFCLKQKGELCIKK